MIVDIGKFYLYRHIRLDKNEPFYIGIGTKNTKDLNSNLNSIIYRRAYCKSRNSIWKNITNKTQYKIEILLESNDYEFIKEKEKEFISIYGRKNYCDGLLSNLSEGGDGSTGFKMSQEQKNHLSLIKKGKVRKECHLSKEVFVYSLNGDFFGKYYSRRQCALSLNMDKGCIDQVLKGKIPQCFGYTFKSEYLGEKIPKTYKKGLKAVEILNKNTFEIINSFDSVTETAKFLKTSTSNISKACKNINKIVKGYKVRYKKVNNIEDNQEIND
jgi:hypothetical protein